MRLSEALEQERSYPLKRAECGIQKILKQLDSEDRDELLSAFLSEMNSSRIANALSAVEIEVSASTVRRHRRGECRCPQWES